MMEHPAFLTKHMQLGTASVWRLLDFARLMAVDVCDLHLVHRSQFGMKAYTPTFFAGWHLDSFNQNLDRFNAPLQPHQIRALSGRNADGSYKTAVGKEYPGPLCQAIATSFADCALLAESTAVPPLAHAPSMDFHSLVKPFIVSISESPEDFGAYFVDGGELPLLQLPKL